MYTSKDKDKIKKALGFADSAGYEKGHTAQVRALAIEMFDALEQVHGLGQRERGLLEQAAILHDIGYSRGGKDHHKTARDMVMQAKELPFATDRERTIVAMVIRYHKGALPEPEHKYYADLDPEAKQIVDKLSAILRVADGMDRTHLAVVRDLKCEVLPDQIVVKVKAAAYSEIDDEAAREKSDLFRKVFGKEIEIKWA